MSAQNARLKKIAFKKFTPQYLAGPNNKEIKAPLLNKIPFDVPDFT